MLSFPKTAILLYLLLCFSILFSVPIAQQILGFLWLLIIPGYALLRILKTDEWDLLGLVVFSAGLGLAIVMFLGLILNSVFLVLNLPQPLSAISFTAAIGGLTLVLLLLGRNQERNKSERTFSEVKVGLADILQIFALATVLIISITGALYQNVSFLLLMIMGISLLVATSVLSERWIPSKLFPLVIALCSVALLFQTVLVSKHLMGVDIFLEFYVFKQTEARGFWLASGNILQYSLINDLNSILSVTILPVAGTAVLGIDGELFFKLFYPFVFSIVPLALYKMYQQQFNKKTAFLSAMFYVSAPTVFYGIEPLALCRQMIGMLFLTLSVMLILEKKLVLWKKRILLVILVSALITTHYALAYIFLFYAMVFFISPRILFFLRKGMESARALIESDGETISFAMILLLTALTFSWYIYVSSSPLNHLLSSFNRITNWFIRDLGSSEARGFGGQLSSLSPFLATSIVGLAHKILIYTQFLFIGIGVTVAAIKPRLFSLSSGHRLLSLSSAAILLLCFGVPNLATTLNATRFYAILVPFLAPFFVIGGAFLVDVIVRSVSTVLPKPRRISVRNLGLYTVTFVLIATFLFQVGFVNHVTNDYPYSYSLDLDRKEKSNSLSIKTTTHSLYFLDQEVRSSEWLAGTANVNLKIYADWNSQCSVLKSYATLADDRMIQITNGSEPESQTYIYLKYLTVQLGLISLQDGGFLNSSTALPALASYDQVYSNGISDVYFVP